MKRILFAVIVLIGVVAAGAYIYVSKAIAPAEVPSNILSAENAIASTGTIAIASIDMKYARRIQDFLQGEKDPSPLTKPDTESAKTAKSIFDKLSGQGVDLYSETDYALMSINASQAKPAHTFLVYGRFSVDKIKQAVRKYYMVDESDDQIWLIEALPQQSQPVDPCADKRLLARKRPPQKHALHLHSDRLILSSPELMQVLLDRFAANASADISLNQWRAFRKDKVAAAVFMSPKEAKKSAADLPTAMLLGAVSDQPLEAVYAGAKVDLLPMPGLTMSVDFYASDASWPQKFKTGYDKWLNETLAAIKNLPTLALVMQSLKVQPDGDVLHMKAMADRTTVANLDKIPGEFFQMMFSSMSVNSNDGKPGASDVEEQIVKADDMEKYLPMFDISNIPPFEENSAFSKPDYVTGPIGIMIERIGLLATDESIIELTIKADGKGFANVSEDFHNRMDDMPTAGLWITAVEDEAGNNLLREELCGDERNLAPQSLSVSPDREFVDKQWVITSTAISGKKTIRLNPNVTLEQVAKVEGKVSLRVATRTHVETIQQPLAGKSIDTGQVRMYLENANEDTVKYQLSGKTDLIMAVRAKNAKGEYLATGGGGSAGGPSGKSISALFKGKVASIEVVIADEKVTKDYPFVINEISPDYQHTATGRPVVNTSITKKAFLQKYKNLNHDGRCEAKQSIELGAFLVCVKEFGSRWGREIGGEFDVFAPPLDLFQKNLAIGTLGIDSLVTQSGEKIPFKKEDKLSFNYRHNSRYDRATNKHIKLDERLYDNNVRAYVSDDNLKNKKINMVNGTLIVRLPKQHKYIELDAEALRISKKADNGLVANIAGFDKTGTYIDLQGPVNSVLRFVALSKDGTILKTDNDRINEKQYYTWNMLEEDKEDIESLPKKWTGMITIYGKPQVIRVYYADDFEVIKYPFSFSVE